MSTFANSFWSTDYAGGLGVLFAKLQQGVQENEQLLSMARLRAEAEDTYGQKLGDIEAATDRIDGGFQRDDGASVKKAYEGVRTEMGQAAQNHRKIASNIRELVINPFSRWCDQHAARVQNSQDDLQARIKAHDRQAETVRQYRSAYYNKCRRVEDLDEEEKLAFQDPNSTATTTGSPKAKPTSVPSIKVEEQVEEQEPVDIGDATYTPDQLKKVLTHLLDHIHLGEAKVPILGTYQNVSTGAEITEYIQAHMGGASMAYAERIGQDLINLGFLRLVGGMGSTFANSSRMNYQWRTKVFEITGVPEKRPKIGTRTSTLASIAASDPGSVPGSPIIGDRVSEYLGNWNPLNTAHPNETPAEKLRREAREADERYKASIKKLDGLRCLLEEAMMDHFKFMERCELDRLKAIKSVVLDFSGALGNVIPSLQSTVDNMMLFQETVQPQGDLRYLLENYRTGSFFPKVTTYENYYNKVDEQTFGVDIEARARSDRKRVPLIVTTILTFLDSHYPDLEGDEARRGVWLVDVPLAATHHLRNQINTGKAIPPALLEKYEVPIVASALKLYLLELPDSLVSSHVYEIVKTIYSSTAPTSSEGARVQVVQSTLGQLRLANIATLDALVTHFTRLIELTSADDEYVTKLATALAPCIMRPKQESGLTMAEKYNVRLIRDLFAHKSAIFGELKRQSALTHTNSGATRQARAISTDESKRREHMEERQRAIAAAQQSQSNHRSRHSSPNGTPRAPYAEAGHRRDRSRGPETRFPVSTTAATQSPGGGRIISPTTSSTSSHRDSLSVPQSPPGTRNHAVVTPSSPSRTTPAADPADHVRSNGTLHRPPPQDDEPSSTRARSNTEMSVKRLPALPGMAASISSPSDYMHYYSSSVDVSRSATPDPPATSGSAASTKPALSDDGPVKRDSLTRPGARASFQRKNTGGLQRQSLIQKHESVDSATHVESPVEHAGNDDDDAASSTAATEANHGIQLEDKPMDFD